MKALPAALQDHLDGGTTTLCWCWRIARRDGAVFGFSDHDRVLSFEGVDFEPETGLTPTDLVGATDLSVDAQDAEGVLRSDRIDERDIRAGVWDGAEVEVWRVNWAAVGQRVLMRRGSIGEIRRGRAAFVAEMRSLAHVLNRPVGRLIQAGCDAELGDDRCGVDLSDPAFGGAGSVLSMLRDRAIVAGGIGGFDPGLFDLGTITWTAGVNVARRQVVARHSVEAGAVVLTLAEAPAEAPVAGDTFDVVAGCDKRLETCAGRFGNVVNFRGFPHVPGTDAVLRAAGRAAGDGAVQ